MSPTTMETVLCTNLLKFLDMFRLSSSLHTHLPFYCRWAVTVQFVTLCFGPGEWGRWWTSSSSASLSVTSSWQSSASRSLSSLTWSSMSGRSGRRCVPWLHSSSPSRCSSVLWPSSPLASTDTSPSSIHFELKWQRCRRLLLYQWFGCFPLWSVFPPLWRRGRTRTLTCPRPRSSARRFCGTTPRWSTSTGWPSCFSNTSSHSSSSSVHMVGSS